MPFNWMASRLAKLDEMKEDFIAHISRGLRTPLTAMREGTSLLWEEILAADDLSAEIVNVMRSHSERLYQFLSSALDLSKMERDDGIRPECRPICQPCLRGASKPYSSPLGGRGIRLEVLCPTALPLLFLDEVRMQQVLDNLLNNATKLPQRGASSGGRLAHGKGG